MPLEVDKPCKHNYFTRKIAGGSLYLWHCASLSEFNRGSLINRTSRDKWMDIMDSREAAARRSLWHATACHVHPHTSRRRRCTPSCSSSNTVCPKCIHIYNLWELVKLQNKSDFSLQGSAFMMIDELMRLTMCSRQTPT
jgi:hypothetical protein